MSEVVKTKVPFIAATVAKCLCPKCDVQIKSACATGEMAKFKDAIKKTPLKADEIPAAYCASGKATCTDLNFALTCICGTCPVWTEYKLDAWKYCKNGAAK